MTFLFAFFIFRDSYETWLTFFFFKDAWKLNSPSSSELDSSFPGESFTTFHPSSQEKISSFVPSNIKEIDAASLCYSSFLSRSEAALLRMKFIRLTSSRFQSTSKFSKYFFRMISPLISDSNVDSFSFILPSNPASNSKTKKTLSSLPPIRKSRDVENP